MRFKTEQEGLQSLIGKEMPDPRYLKGRVAPKAIDASRLSRNDKTDLRKDYEAWLDAKRLMFSPEEQIALMGVDHRGRTGLIDQDFKDHVVNVFVAWTEGKPLKEELIAVGLLISTIGEI